MPPNTTVRAALPRLAADLVPAQRVERVDADADDVAGAMASKSIGSSVSSMTLGSPYPRGVAAASTYSQRGVITAVPNEISLGLTRWILILSTKST